MGARIGVVGLGRIGSYHARNLLTLNGVDALVVTDVDARRTSDVATELDVQSATDPAALLASGIDGVLIAASSSSHAELIEAAVRRDIPTFCEKPVADSIESSVRVLATAEQTSVPVQIGFQRRFDPSFVAAYDAVRSGELGWIHTLRSTTLDPAPPPISYIEHSGGIFRDCSIHDFDIVRWISGREVTTVFATGRIRVIAGSPMPVTSTPPQRFSLSKAEPSRSCRIPATTAAATTATRGTRLGGLRRCWAGRPLATPLPRPRNIVPLEGAVHVLHGPLHVRLPCGTRSIPRRCRRASGITVHARRCGRVGLDLRSCNALSARGSARHDHRSQRSVPSRQE